MNKIKVAVDLDDTLAQTNQRMVELLNEDLGLRLTLDDFTEWEWWKNVEPFKYIGEAFGPKAATNLVWRLYAIAWWSEDKVKPREYAISNMQVLAEDRRFEIDIVSQRQLFSVRDVAKWLRLHDVPFRALAVLDAFGSYSKADLDYSIFVDDSPTLAAKVSVSSKRLILMDRPWNRHIADSIFVKRAKTWADVDALMNSFWHELTWTPY